MARMADEGVRYLAASALALAVDFGVFMGLHRIAGLDYRFAAPIGFTLGLALIYVLSIRWIVGERSSSLYLSFPGGPNGNDVPNNIVSCIL